MRGSHSVLIGKDLILFLSLSVIWYKMEKLDCWFRVSLGSCHYFSFFLSQGFGWYAIYNYGQWLRWIMNIPNKSEFNQGMYLLFLSHEIQEMWNPKLACSTTSSMTRVFQSTVWHSYCVTLWFNMAAWTPGIMPSFYLVA